MGKIRYTSDLEHYILMVLWQVFGAIFGAEIAMVLTGMR